MTLRGVVFASIGALFGLGGFEGIDQRQRGLALRQIVTQEGTALSTVLKYVSFLDLWEESLQGNLAPRYLLFLGTLEPRKNVLMLLRVYFSLPGWLREGVDQEPKEEKPVDPLQPIETPIYKDSGP